MDKLQHQQRLQSEQRNVFTLFFRAFNIDRHQNVILLYLTTLLVVRVICHPSTYLQMHVLVSRSFSLSVAVAVVAILFGISSGLDLSVAVAVVAILFGISSG